MGSLCYTQYFFGETSERGIRASVKLGDTLGMLLTEFYVVLAVILINDRKPISMVKLNSYFCMPKCKISEYITASHKRCDNSVTKL